MPRTRPPYPPEFRAEAVELIRSGTKRLAELSRDLGVADQTLATGCASEQLGHGRQQLPGTEAAISLWTAIAIVF